MSEKETNKAVYSKKGNPFGTHQWADDSENCITGCGNGCLYCYARAMAVKFGQVSPDDWVNEFVREKDLTKKIKKYSNAVMFPSSHDVRPEHLEENMIMLQKILEAGNDVLLVTKPHLECIKEICSRFKAYIPHILFRFTIGSADDEVLKFWEPNAPGFKERLESLKWAYKKGFQTSISCEPMLDNNIDEVIKKVSPYVTETIWLGKANHLIGKKGRGRLEFNGVATLEAIGRAKELISWQSDENIMELYNKYENNPMIRWKESIERVVAKNL